jgi:hypothetical protein
VTLSEVTIHIFKRPKTLELAIQGQSENESPRRIFGLTRKEVIGSW